MSSPSLPASRFKSILFCTDFSESANAAFEFALDATICRPGSKLYVLHVIPEPDAQFWKSYIAGVEGIDRGWRETLENQVNQKYRSRVPKEANVDVEVAFRSGPEAATILEFARSEQVDVIILGRHGHSGMGKALFGTVAEKIVRKAECAVLVVPMSATKCAC